MSNMEWQERMIIALSIVVVTMPNLSSSTYCRIHIRKLLIFLRIPFRMAYLVNYCTWTSNFLDVLEFCLE